MRLLVTGATGFFGSEIVPRLLANGHEVIALSRQRHVTLYPGVEYIVSDLATGCIPPVEADAVLHLAGIVNLRSNAQVMQSCWNTNVSGSIALVQAMLTGRVTTRRLFHVSTLYVCGYNKAQFTELDLPVQRTGSAREWRPEFRNPYEYSKALFEHNLRQYDRIDWTVFRPGVLIGGYTDGHASMFEGFYRPVGAFLSCERFAEKHLHLPKRERLEKALGLPPLTLPIRISGDPESHLALTPVDWAAEAIVRLVGTAELYQTYHIVPDRLPTNLQMITAIQEALGLRGIEFSLEPRRSPLDLLYNRLVRNFIPYLRDQPDFQTSVGYSCPLVDHEYLVRVVRYWREHDRRIPRLEIIDHGDI